MKACETRVLAAIERIVNAEAEASGAPQQPEITTLDRLSARSATIADASEAGRRCIPKHFGAERVREDRPASASEDFGSFGAEWRSPSVFWFVGGTDPRSTRRRRRTGSSQRDSYQPHPAFAPVIHPTLRPASKRCSSVPRRGFHLTNPEAH